MKTRSVAVFVSMLCAIGLLAAPAGAATERVGGFAVTLPSDATLSTIQPDDLVRVSLAPSREGAPACFGVDFGVSWQVLAGGRWTDVSFGVVYPAVILNLLPGEKQVQRVTVPRNTRPGSTAR